LARYSASSAFCNSCRRLSFASVSTTTPMLTVKAHRTCPMGDCCAVRHLRRSATSCILFPVVVSYYYTRQRPARRHPCILFPVVVSYYYTRQRPARRHP
jgi:hypothetical protein